MKTIVRAGAAILLVLLLAAGGRAADDGRQELARALAAFMLDEEVRRGLDEQVAAGMMRTIGATLQDRLNRRLLDVEWRIVADIVRRFVNETLPSSHAEEIAARVYARQFEETELRELLRFQQSAVGQKAARLAPVIRLETAEAIDAELRESPAVARMVEELQRQFPVLRGPESP
jgi:hypothetical protein